MGKAITLLEKKFYYNCLLVIFSFLMLMKPYFLGVNFFINGISNFFIIILSVIIYFIYFYRNRISKIQLVFFLLFFIQFLSTIFVSKDLVCFFKYFLQFSTISLYSELLIKNNLSLFFKAISILLYGLIFFNFITLLIFPEGIFGKEVLLLGYDNATIVLLVLGSMFIVISSYFKYQKIQLWSLLPFILTVYTYFFRWSVGAMIGCIVLLMYFLIFYRFPKISKILNIRVCFWFSVILFILIVVFGVQNYFSFIIEDIFHKNLTLTGRTLIWKRCFEQIFNHPFLGIGMMEYATRFDLIGIYHAHSTILNVILECGFIGLAVYFYLWHIVINSMIQNKENRLIQILSFTFLSYFVMTSIDVIDNSQLLYVFLNLAYYSPYIIRKSCSISKNPNVLLVLDSGQPLPAVMGGAVETLVDAYINYNENNPRYEFDIFSTYHKAVEGISKKYIHSRFYYINNKKITFQMKRVIKGIIQKLFHIKLESVFSYELLNRLEIENKKNYYNIILIENAPSIILNLKKNIKGKYILHLHNDISIISHYHQCLEKYDLIISCSNYIKNRVESFYLSANVVNVYNGVDNSQLLQYASYRDKMRCLFKINKSDFVFGYCGRICSEKGIKELILAFKRLLSTHSNIKLLIAGSSFFKGARETPFINELRKEICGIENSIIFTGYIEHSEIGKFFASIDVSVHPSIVNEACPLSVLEAQAFGLPIICSDSGGMPELVTSKNSIIVSRTDLEDHLFKAMENILNDFQQISKMKKASYKNSRQYNLDKYVKKFYKEIGGTLK